MVASMNRRHAIATLLFVSLIVWVLYTRLNPPVDAEAFHLSIVEGVADSPYRYRILVPWLLQWLTVAGMPLAGSLSLYTLVAIALMLIALYDYLSLWFSADQSMIAVLVAAFSATVTFPNFYAQWWTWLEVVFMTFGLLLMYRKQYAALAVLVALATLNRETALILPILFVLTLDGFDRRRLGWATVYFVLWGAVFVGLRLWLGDAPHAVSQTELWARNLSPSALVTTAIGALLFFGAFWWFALRGFRHAPPFVRRSALILPVYLALIAVYGVWTEVRLLMPLYPILLPLAMAHLSLTQDSPALTVRRNRRHEAVA